ncbi:FxLD family lanthipeptide [Streptomyces flavofungini]
MDTLIETVPFATEEWELDITITDTPRIAASDECDTSDGCESTCDSSCTS